MGRASMVLVAAFVVSSVAGQDSPTPSSNDCLCQELSRRYLPRGRKVSSDNLKAAIQLLSTHARHNDYWRIILDDWRHCASPRETHYVRVLGKMLAIDALGRDIEALPPEKLARIASSPGIALDESVLPELVARARQADRLTMDHYVIAVARARDRRSVSFLAQILADPQRDHALGTQFHAAVGLANLGDARGVVWLIDHVDKPGAGVAHARPPGVSLGNLDECCVWALRSLSGKRGLGTEAEWRDWWAAVREGFAPVNVVQLVD